MPTIRMIVLRGEEILAILSSFSPFFAVNEACIFIALYIVSLLVPSFPDWTNQTQPPEKDWAVVAETRGIT